MKNLSTNQFLGLVVGALLITAMAGARIHIISAISLATRIG